MERINYVLNLDLTNISSEQLQDVYKITQESMRYFYNNKNGLTDNTLKCQIALDLYHICHCLPYNKQEMKQKCLDKAYEFNNSISSDCTIADIEFINRNLRIPLVNKFIEVGGEENLDKAKNVFQQVLDTLEGISSKELKEYSSYHFISDETLEDKITEKEQKEVREKAKIVFAELLKEKTHTNNNLRETNKNLEKSSGELNEQMSEISNSASV